MNSVVSGRSEPTAHPSSHCDGLSSNVGSLVSAQEGDDSADFFRISDSEGKDKVINYQYICIQSRGYS